MHGDDFPIVKIKVGLKLATSIPLYSAEHLATTKPLYNYDTETYKTVEPATSFFLHFYFNKFVNSVVRYRISQIVPTL